MRRDHSSESRSHRHPIAIENFPSIGSYVAIASLAGRDGQSLDIFDIENHTLRFLKNATPHNLLHINALILLLPTSPPRLMTSKSLNYQPF